MRPPNATLPPHIELLFRCANATAGRDPQIDAALTHPNIAWPNFVEQSVRHGIAGLAAWNLRPFANDPRVPAEVNICLERMLNGNTRRNAVMFAETARFVTALTDAGVRSVVLKGVALSNIVYDEPGLRNFADIDILVDSANFERAAQIAETCGYAKYGCDVHTGQMEVTYVAHAKEDILTPTVAPEYMPTLTPEVLTRDGRRIVIEIHGSLGRFAGGFVRHVDMEPFWENLQPLNLPGGCPCWTLSSEATLVHLCQHAGYHQFQRLIFAVDVARLIGVFGERMHWDRVDTIASAVGEQNNVLRMLDFVRREWSADLPGIEKTGASMTPLQLSDFFQPATDDRRDLFWTQVSGLQWREFAAACRRMMFPPAAYMREVHGVRSRTGIAMAYVYRPFYLAGHLLQVLWKRLVGRRQSMGR